jgi:hypothetical protein
VSTGYQPAPELAELVASAAVWRKLDEIARRFGTCVHCRTRYQTVGATTLCELSHEVSSTPGPVPGARHALRSP